MKNICACVYAVERSSMSFALVFMRMRERENNCKNILVMSVGVIL